MFYSKSTVKPRKSDTLNAMQKSKRKDTLSKSVDNTKEYQIYDFGLITATPCNLGVRTQTL